MTVSASRVLLLVSVILFVLAGLGVDIGSVGAHDLGWFGGAFGFGSFLA